MKLPMQLTGGKYSTTFASGFQTVSQTASALAYELLRPQFTPRAPMGCLQYFTQSSGIIESFNFGQYLNNMDYSICIQRQPDTCRVVFTSSDYDWSLNGVGVSSSSSGVGDQDCARDYLLVPGASRTGDGFTYDRYCGGRLHYYRGQSLSAPLVIKTAGPIVLRFHSDNQYEGLNNGGFRLQYDQSAQDCIYHTAEEAGSLASQQLLASTLADSRPLSQQLGSLINESPVLYSSQQQLLPPMHQLTSEQHQEQSTGSSSSSNNNNIQLANSFGQSHSAAKLAASEQQQQQQLETKDAASQSDHNSIKRNDFVTTTTTTSAAAAAQDEQQVNSNRLRYGNKFLELSKAFQLVTSAGHQLLEQRL